MAISLPTCETAWYRSLYFKLGAGFAASLTGLLFLQAWLPIWIISRSDGANGNRPTDLAHSVAADLATTLSVDPTVDLTAYVTSRYNASPFMFAVMMDDGRVITAQPGLSPLPPPLPPGIRGSWMPVPGVRLPPPSAEIQVDGRRVGSVVAVPSGDFARLRTLVTSVATGLGLLGTVLSVLLVFAPARRRIRSLETIASRVGRGDLAARANERGGDELATLSRAFNRMAQDLGERASEIEAEGLRRRRLLADVSHELLTPLTTMRGYLETLRMPEMALDSETRSRYTGIVSDEVERLALLVGDLLDLAILEEGRLRLEIEDVAVEQLLGRQMARFENEAHIREVGMTATTSPGAAIVAGDQTRLDQALRNLTANALRHTPPGGHVALTATLEGETVVLSVTDTGTGILPEDLPFLFDRFYKGDRSRTASSGGRGLGLSIVKAIAEGHGGRVSVRSEPGSGSTFTIHLPAEIGTGQEYRR